jgi:hypothetical protein
MNRPRLIALLATLGLAAVVAVPLFRWRSGSDPVVAPATDGKRSDVPPAGPSAPTPSPTPYAAHINPGGTLLEDAPVGETLSTWFDELPRASGLPADVHHAPPGIARSGERFGAIVEAAKRSRAFRAEAARFFRTCAEDVTVLDGIRALCLYNWRDFRPSDGGDEPATDERIRRIADFLPKRPGN